MSKAPSVTLERIEGIIRHEFYTTADRAFGMPDVPPLGLLTLCVLVLANGFTVVGQSACVSPENFDAELGKQIARRKALEQVWALEGYLLREGLNMARQNKAL